MFMGEKWILALNSDVRTLNKNKITHSLRTADAFPVVASVPPFRGREATTGNASAVRRLDNTGLACNSLLYTI